MGNSKRTRLLADLTLLLVALLWGTTFVGSKMILDHFSPLYIIAIRFVLATGVMSLIFFKKLKQIKKEDIRNGGIVGAVLFVAFSLQLFGLQYTEPGKQAFLAGTYVVMVPFLAWALHKKRPDVRAFLGAFICFLGIGFLTLNESFSIGFGDGITMVSSAFFAGHIMVNGHFAKKMDVVILSIIQFGTLAVLSLVAALFFETPPSGVSTGAWLGIIYLGIFCSAGAYFLQTVAQKYTLATHASLLLSLEAVFGSLFAVLLFGETFSVKMIVGCVAIFGAILISELRPEEKPEPETK